MGHKFGLFKMKLLSSTVTQHQRWRFRACGPEISRLQGSTFEYLLYGGMLAEYEEPGQELGQY